MEEIEVHGFELKKIVINESKFPELFWDELLIGSNVLINLVMIKENYFFGEIPGFGAVVCFCCSLVVFFLRSEPRKERLSAVVQFKLEITRNFGFNPSVHLSVRTVLDVLFFFRIRQTRSTMEKVE